LPNYAAWGFLVATIGCFAGNNFGFLGLLESAIQIPEAQQRAGMEQHAGAFVATLFVPGLLFPLSLLVLGIQLIRARQVPLWVGILLCLGAIGFPASRIGRIQALAHIDDVVLLVACGTLAWQLIRQPATPVTAPVPAAATV